MTQSNNHILINQYNGVLEITLNRPDKKNALTNHMYGEMVRALTAAKDNDDIRVVLLTANGDFFSAGNDLTDFLMAANAKSNEDMHAWTFIKLIGSYPKPLIAAVTGAGIGIGTTLLLHCDLVYIHKQAQLITPFVNLALVPEAGSSLLLVQRIGYARAFEMLATGTPITGEQAWTWGLANGCFDTTDEVVANARARAEFLAKQPANALQQTKHLMRQSAEILAQMDKENVQFAQCLTSAEARQIFERFLNNKSTQGSHD